MIEFSNSYYFPTTPIPSILIDASKLGVVANDAGAAEQITWVLRHLTQVPSVFLSGPAESIFSNSKILYSPALTLQEVLFSSILIVGSGWMTNWETDAINAAHANKIPTFAVLDHWMNYRERFGNATSLPSYFGVTNELAFELASQAFPDRPVVKIPDFQLMHYRDYLDSNSRGHSNILLLLEPNTNFLNGSNFGITEKIQHEALEFAVKLKNIHNSSAVVVRLHPSQKNNPRLEDSILSNSTEVKLSYCDDLLEDLSMASHVIGFNTYGLYLSSMCGIKTHSYFAQDSNHWSYDFANIDSFIS